MGFVDGASEPRRELFGCWTRFASDGVDFKISSALASSPSTMTSINATRRMAGR